MLGSWKGTSKPFLIVPSDRSVLLITVGPSDPSWVYINEGLRMGLVAAERPVTWLEGWGSEPHYSAQLPLGRGGAWRLSSINHVCITKPQWKLWHWKLRWASCLVNAWTCWEGDVSWFHREGAWRVPVWDPPNPHPTCLFLWLVLNCIFYSKTVITRYSTFLSSVIHPSKLWNLRGSWESLNL